MSAYDGIDSGLLAVRQPSLVERYNACLEEIGLPRTYRTAFRVDGWGWSPEIAEEREDPFYLSHLGPANPYAILLSPAQRELPIHFPYHSFDRDLMAEVFRTAGRQIADLTASTALWIDVDQEIAAYREPRDLLMVEAITLRFRAAGGLMAAAAEQRELVRRFRTDRLAWADRELLARLAANAARHGDLRYRSLDIPDIPYTHTRCFHSRAFGGVYVFRDLPGGRPLLVVADPAQPVLPSGEDAPHLEYRLHDPDLLALLYREQLVDLQPSLYRDNPALLERLAEAVLLRAIAEADPAADLGALGASERKRRRLVLERDGLLPPLYGEVERLLLLLHRGQAPDLSGASPELTRALTHPHRRLPEGAWNTVRHLLVQLSPHDVVRLHAYDKPAYVAARAAWPENYRRWADAVTRRHERGV
jgi:hypothetical protein